MHCRPGVGQEGVLGCWGAGVVGTLHTALEHVASLYIFCSTCTYKQSIKIDSQDTDAAEQPGPVASIRRVANTSALTAAHGACDAPIFRLSGASQIAHAKSRDPVDAAPHLKYADIRVGRADRLHRDSHPASAGMPHHVASIAPNNTPQTAHAAKNSNGIQHRCSFALDRYIQMLSHDAPPLLVGRHIAHPASPRAASLPLTPTPHFFPPTSSSLCSPPMRSPAWQYTICNYTQNRCRHVRQGTKDRI
jgi:hypothetical protein